MVLVPACPVLLDSAGPSPAPGGCSLPPAQRVLDGGGGVLGPEAFDAELAVVPDGAVRWAAGGLLRKQFTGGGPVRKASPQPPRFFLQLPASACAGALCRIDVARSHVLSGSSTNAFHHCMPPVAPP